MLWSRFSILFRFDVAMERVQLLGDSLHIPAHMYVLQCFTCSLLKVFHLFCCCSGDPIISESSWKIHKIRFVFVNHPSDKVSYLCKSSSHVPGLPCYMREELEGAMREIHDCIGNAVVNNKTIVVGNGSSQTLTATLFVLANRDEGAPYCSVSRIFHFTLQQSAVECFKLYVKLNLQFV